MLKAGLGQGARLGAGVVLRLQVGVCSAGFQRVGWRPVPSAAPAETGTDPGQGQAEVSQGCGTVPTARTQSALDLISSVSLGKSRTSGLVFQLYFSRRRVAPWPLDTFLSKSQDGCCMARATGMSSLGTDTLGAMHGLWLCDFS